MQRTKVVTHFILCCIFYIGRSNESEDCTKGCELAGISFRESIDFTKDPCENFFEYSCTNWIRRHPIPEDKTTFDVATIVADSVKEDMLGLLGEEEDQYDSKSIKLTKQLYKKCMNAEALSTSGSSSIHEFIRSLGGWPMLDNGWKVPNIDWTDLLSIIKAEYGEETFVNLVTWSDWMNSSNNILYVDQGKLGLGESRRDVYLNDEQYGSLIAAYKKKIFNMAHLIANDMKLTTVDDDHLSKSIDRMIEFERKMAGIVVADEDRQDVYRMYNRMTVKNLSAIFTQIEWPRYMKRVLPEEVYARLIQDKPDEFSLVVMEPEYCQKINDLLAATPAKEIINFLVWTVVKKGVQYFDIRFEDADQEFEAAFSGRKAKEPRTLICSKMAETMDMAYGALYVRKHFSVQDRNAALSMIKDMKDALRVMLDEQDWLDDSTRGFAKEKIEYIIDKVGFPDLAMNDTALDEIYYKNLTWSLNDSSLTLFDLAMKIDKWYQNSAFFQLLKTVDRERFADNPATVDAVYDPTENSIIFRAGILRRPFFDGSFPKYVNYGAIGSIIAHELTHALDNIGSQFNKLGVLENWWSPEAAEKFQRKTQCIIDQYSNFVVPDVNKSINGELTQAENIADNGGLKLAYLAYQKFVKRNGNEPLLPVLNLTIDQAFFISFSQVWCGARTPEAQELWLLEDRHSLNMFRVNGAVSNSPDFAHAFQCPPRSPMNPSEKCTVW